MVYVLYNFERLRKIRLDGCHCDIYVLICDLNHASISVTFSLEQRQDLYDRPIQQPNVHLRNYTPSKNEIDNRSYFYKNASKRFDFKSNFDYKIVDFL